MKKSIITALMILTIITYSVIPFSVHASTSLFNATNGDVTNYDNTKIGRYNVYTATATNSNLQFYFMDQFFDYDQYKSASITDIQFNDSYDEYMTLVYGSNLNDDLVWIESDGSALLNINQRAVNLTLNDVSWIRIFVVSTDTTANNIQPTSISPTLSKSSLNINLDPVINNQIIQRWFPDYNLVGYLWGASYGAYQTLGTTYSEIPFVYIPVSAHDGAFTLRHRLFVPKGTIQEFYFLSTWWLTTERVHVYFEGNYSLDWSIQVIKQYSSDDSTAYHTVYLHKFTIDGSQRNGDSIYELEFTGNIFACPIYYGTKNQIPDGVALMLGTDFNNTYTKLLKDIADSLDAQGDPNVSPGLDDTNNQIIDLQDQESQIVSGFQDDLTQFNTDMDLSDYDFITGFQNSNNYFKMLLDNMYVNSSSIRAFWVIPVILVIFMAITGRK